MKDIAYCQKKLRSLWVMVVLLAATVAQAHDPKLSAIRIEELPAGLEITVSAHADSLVGRRAKDDSARIDLAVRNRLRVQVNGAPMSVKTAKVQVDKATGMARWQTTVQGKPTGLEVLARLFPEDNTARTLVTIAKPGVADADVLLDSDHPTMQETSVAPPRSEIAKRFVSQGIAHILSGLDHVLFVVGLLLLGGGLKTLLKIVTAFTIAHSLTLTLAVTGMMAPPSRIVEPLIALSIVAVAFENLRPKAEVGARNFRPWVAFGFGLVHGFGFAGALTEIGLSGIDLGVGLISFNLGVELGQAMIVVVAAPLISILAYHRPRLWRPVVVTGSVGIAALGALWFVTRIVSG